MLIRRDVYIRCSIFNPPRSWNWKTHFVIHVQKLIFLAPYENYPHHLRKMPASSGSQPHRTHTESNPTAGPSHKPRPVSQRDPSGLPGISKIKASIRQTNRLLAKVSLIPGSMPSSDHLVLMRGIGYARAWITDSDSAKVDESRSRPSSGGEEGVGEEEWRKVSYGEMLCRYDPRFQLTDVFGIGEILW